MSRRGWKERRAELFDDAGGAFGAVEAPAPQYEAASDVWDDAPASDVWSDAPSTPVPVPRKLARKPWRAPRAEPQPEPAPTKRARKPWRAPREEALPKDLVGRDLAGAPRRARARRRLPLPVLAGAIIAALLLVTLRVEILRLRYAAAEVAAEEQALRERIAQTKVRVGELRGPARLRKLAAERGFVRPERVLTVPVPARVADVAAAPRLGARP